MICSTSPHHFNCSDSDLNDFFTNDCVAYSQQLMGKSYCFTLNEDESQIICAFTISNDSIKARLLPKSTKNKVSRSIDNQKRGLKSYPAVLIGRLGVAKNFEGKGIGKKLMDFIKAWFIDGANKTGCRFIVVDAYNNPGVISFYKRNGYKPLFNTENKEKEYSAIESDDQLDTRLLYFDLIVLVGTVSS